MSPDSQLLIRRLKAAADATRLRLLALCQRGECSVSELTAVLGISQPRVSQQLKVLCDSGMLQRFRDGQRVFYRWPTGTACTAELQQLLALLQVSEPQFEADASRLKQLRGIDEPASRATALSPDAHERLLHRAMLELTVTQSVGDLLDIGCGRGRLLKLMSSRANRAVGVDIDASARDLARNELLLAGLDNCSLRNGDMYSLPFDGKEFDTIILDDILATAARPVEVLKEAQRVLREGGRLLLLQKMTGVDLPVLRGQLATWSHEAGLRLKPARFVPQKDPVWLLAEARPAVSASAAA
ncbi:MAG: metalloregulator ArsR/SmtB family transcription factor [Woeseia sp.]|nr:metalloregulator ArsR/SmtB family transcription factor [Woeseia sp.]MBT8096292.1 metalloregulator ArsR/SmtB family transcription factor [Woeseia sp.]NNL54208.1 metalloregulator ArsR/SmtB family transcription factor [Woeseia sp.]